MTHAGELSVSLTGVDGSVTALRGPISVQASEVIDAAVMKAEALDAFLMKQIARAKADGVLFSAHLKATMMKISDPIIFGHVVRAFFPQTFATYGDSLAAAGLSANDGLGTIFGGLEALPNGHGGLREGNYQPSCLFGRDR